MPRLSTAARKRISEAQKKRWAAVRRQGKAGSKKKGRTQARRGRPRKAASSAGGGNAYLRMTITELAPAKQQSDAAWKLAAKLLRRG